MTDGHGGELRKSILWIMAAVAVFCIVDVVYVAFQAQNERMVFLEEQNQLLRESLEMQKQYCDGVGQVNQICESAMVTLVERLGLDVDKLPVFTAGVIARHHAGQGGP